MKIISFYINNYRSLVDFKITDFDDTTIFYGENNAGKSNVLSALSIIFQRKKKRTSEEKQNFYEGIIEGFSNNFFGNKTNEIDFMVELEVNRDELDLVELLQKEIKLLNTNTFTIFGKIEKASRDLADISTEQIMLNRKIIYKGGKTFDYFPMIKKKSIEQGYLSESFSKLIYPLNDCITTISSYRDMHKARFTENIANDIEPSAFKNFMHSLYLSEENHSIFENINQVLRREPFNFGEISFSRENGLLELMIKENNTRLPIKHLGSGVLQTLYIIASIVYSKHKIICIEELEQNLSPRRQNFILRKLQSLINDEEIGDLQQIILSSHSPVFSSNKLGLIYYLDKKDGKTIISEMKPKAADIKKYPGLKGYFRPTVHGKDTYSAKEMDERVKENIELGNQLLKR